MAEIPEEKRVYVDETGIDKYLQREHGRALRGKKVQDTKRGRKFQRTNVIGALCDGQYLAIETYNHTTNSEFFEAWFERVLLKELPVNHTIIMDRASFHRRNQLQSLAKQAGVNLLFLPAYSPDFNPIEQSWANLKRWLVDNLSRFRFFDFAISDYFYVSDS